MLIMAVLRYEPEDADFALKALDQQKSTAGIGIKIGYRILYSCRPKPLKHSMREVQTNMYINQQKTSTIS